MNFAYSSIISQIPGSGEFVFLRRPEIPVTIIGPKNSATYLGLVDTGSDNTIFLLSIAQYLGISTDIAEESTASVFGGNRIELYTGEAKLRLEADDAAVEFLWIPIAR